MALAVEDAQHRRHAVAGESNAERLHLVREKTWRTTRNKASANHAE